MIKIEDVTPGKSYACKFKVKTMLDDLGRPAPNLSDQPISGPGEYEGFGPITTRDMQSEHVRVFDEKSSKEFVVPFSDIWDVDDVEWVEPLTD